MMQDYSWPGNIRELRNIIERAVIISNEDEIGPDALHLFTVEDRPETKSRVLDPVKDLKTAMEELELEYINHAYEKYGNVREAADRQRSSGRDRNIRKMRIDRWKAQCLSGFEAADVIY